MVEECFLLWDRWLRVAGLHFNRVVGLGCARIEALSSLALLVRMVLIEGFLDLVAALGKQSIQLLMLGLLGAVPALVTVVVDSRQVLLELGVECLPTVVAGGRSGLLYLRAPELTCCSLCLTSVKVFWMWSLSSWK